MNRTLLPLFIVALSLVSCPLEAAGPLTLPFPQQPDTLVYHSFFENPDQPVYVLEEFERYWVTVRFTPLHAFTIREVYFLVENILGSNDPCYVYVALDTGGQPDPAGILAGPFTIPGPLPHAEMITVELDSGVVVDSLQDFHVMVSSGGGTGYSVGLELPADFPQRTGHSAVSNVGPFYEYRFPTPADAIIAVGGSYEQRRDVDLAATCLSNGLDLFFPDALATMGLFLTSDIVNHGADSALQYSLSWTVRDDGGSPVFHYDTAPPPLPPGGSLQVMCPAPWIAASEGEYVITDSLFSQEDKDNTNDATHLEQHVHTSTSQILFYDDAEADAWYQVEEGTTLAVRFAPWSRIASIDSLSLSFRTPSSCIVSVLDGLFTDGLPLDPLFVSADTIFPAGWSTLAFSEPLSPARSTFFVAVTGSGGSASLDVDTDPPLTAGTCLPPQFVSKTEFQPSWLPVVMGDPLIRVYVTAEGLPQAREVDLLACRVEPDTLFTGGTLEVKIYWEFFDLWDGGPLDFSLTTLIADYPPLEIFAMDTKNLFGVEPGIYLDSVTFPLGTNVPAGTEGFSFAFIESPPPASLADSLTGEFFRVVHPRNKIPAPF